MDNPGLHGPALSNSRAVRAASPVEFAEVVLVPGGQSAVEHLLAIFADRARTGRGPRP